MKAVLETCEKFGRAESMSDLTALFSSAVALCGFNRFAYLNMRFHDDKPLWFSTYPREWTEHYLGSGYHSVDPVVRNSECSTIPFAWGSKNQKQNLKGRSRKLFKEAQDWGINVGLTVPIHSPTGTWAALSVASEETDDAFRGAMQESRPALQFMSSYYHTHVEKLFYQPKGEGRVHLSPRELECLKWTAVGKSAWEISAITCLSESTVTGYLESAKRKLGVFNKIHAVTKAIMEGYIKL